jgi:hypothetical protein
VNVPNALKVDVTKLPRDDADAIFRYFRRMRDDPLNDPELGQPQALGAGQYCQAVGSYMVTFYLEPDAQVVNVTAVEAIH